MQFFNDKVYHYFGDPSPEHIKFATIYALYERDNNKNTLPLYHGLIVSRSISLPLALKKNRGEELAIKTHFIRMSVSDSIESGILANQYHKVFDAPNYIPMMYFARRDSDSPLYEASLFDSFGSGKCESAAISAQANTNRMIRLLKDAYNPRNKNFIIEMIEMMNKHLPDYSMSVDLRDLLETFVGKEIIKP